MDSFLERALEFLTPNSAFISTLETAVLTNRLTEPELRCRLGQIQYLLDVGALRTIDEAKLFLLNYPQFLSCRFDILYDDPNVVAINKPFDVRVDIPIKDGKELRHWDSELTPADWFKSRLTDCKKVWLCHQLDHATSGILLLAKSRSAAAAVSKCFSDRTTKKTYIAIVEGHVDEIKWGGKKVEFQVMEDLSHSFKMKVADPLDKTGKSTATMVHIIEKGVMNIYGTNVIDDTMTIPVTKLQLHPITGRRHQLRLLTAHIMGHPIVGDATYGSSSAPDYYRLCLHAASLSLPAIDNGNLLIKAPDPFLNVMS